MASFSIKKKEKEVPETVVGEQGTAKRNILRKGDAVKARKELAPGQNIDDGSTYLDPPSLDRNDPNFDSEEEVGNELQYFSLASILREDVGRSKLTLTSYKKLIAPIITEYFIHGESEETLNSVQEIGAPEYLYEFVKRLVNMSFDKSDRVRELVSKILSLGYPDTLSSNMIGKGFERLFELIDEIEKDVPSAREMMSAFLARAVVDEVLPPAFLSDAVVCNLGGDIIENAKRMLSRDHGGAMLERVWGPGDGRPVEELKVAADMLLMEFLISGDFAEASRCIKELASSEFNHEIVKRAVVQSLDKAKEQQLKMSELFQFLHESDILTPHQAAKGFGRLYNAAGDLSLDTPTAPQIIAEFAARAVQDQVLPADFVFPPAP